MTKEIKIIKEIIRIKRLLGEAGLSELLSNLVYMPVVPSNGIGREFVVGEIMGVKVVFLVPASED